ncbi:hypothetical protein BDR26DRAFT_658953 [Obelidium mucronatum]|nr:hypothetical protein BDR26DRAFT_658953 [Obelidium mucronatum]
MSRKSIANGAADSIAIQVDSKSTGSCSGSNTPSPTPPPNVKFATCSLSSSPSSQNTYFSPESPTSPQESIDYTVTVTVHSIVQDEEWLFWKTVLKYSIGLHCIGILGVIGLGLFGKLKPTEQKMVAVILTWLFIQNIVLCCCVLFVAVGKSNNPLVNQQRKPKVPLKGSAQPDHKGFLVAV